jgi:hypothetical protein
MGQTCASPAVDPGGIAAAIRAGTGHDAIRSQVVGLLREMAVGSADRPVVKHPLGFLCLPIHRQAEFGLCLHVWLEPGLAVQPAQPLTTLPVHYHTWNLYSHVLHGLVRNLRVRVLPDTGAGHREAGHVDGGPAYRVFEVTSAGDVDEIRPTPETVTWQVDGSQQYRAGDRYLVRPRDYHQSAAPDPRPAVTVMLSEGWTPQPQHVLGDLDLPAHTVSRQACSAAEAGVVVDTLLRHLRG